MVVVIRLPGSARDWYEFGSGALDHRREQRGIQQYESAKVNNLVDGWRLAPRYDQSKDDALDARNRQTESLGRLFSKFPGREAAAASA